MQLHKYTDSIWHLYAQSAPKEPEHLKAEIHLDHRSQVDRLVLRTCTPEERLAAKRLAASHLAQYVRHRETSNFMFRRVHQNHGLTDQDANDLMRFDAIPEEIAHMTEEQLDNGLSQHVLVIEAAFATCVETFKSAIERVTALAIRRGGVDPMIGVRPFGEMIVHLPVLFTMPKDGPYAFRFWKSLSPASNLHVIPAYHPAMQPERKRTYLINGDTAALIGQSRHGVRYIHCPLQATRGMPGAFGGWEVNHPFYARGHEVRLDIDPFLCVTTQAADLLTKILIAALELDETYIDVSGGFRAPEGRRARFTGRGSENEGVWGYRTLKEEGELEGAYVPEWLFTEGFIKKRLATTNESR